MSSQLQTKNTLRVAGTNKKISYKQTDSVRRLRNRLAEVCKVDLRCVEIYDAFAFSAVAAADDIEASMLSEPFVFIRCIKCDQHPEK